MSTDELAPPVQHRQPRPYHRPQLWGQQKRVAGQIRYLLDVWAYDHAEEVAAWLTEAEGRYWQADQVRQALRPTEQGPVESAEPIQLESDDRAVYRWNSYPFLAHISPAVSRLSFIHRIDTERL